MKQRRHNRQRHERAGERAEGARESPGERVARAFTRRSLTERAVRERSHESQGERSHESQGERPHESEGERAHEPRAFKNAPRAFKNAPDAFKNESRAFTKESRLLTSEPRASAAHRPVAGDGAHVFGVQPVLELLRAGRRPVERLTVAEGAHEARLHEIVGLARAAGVPVRRVPRAELQRLAAGANHQGVVATVAAARYLSSDELLERLAARVGTEEPPLAVVLDGVEDPRNLGAIIRTVECAGADGVFVPERRAAGLTETVAKSAAGALEYVPVARAANVARLIEELKGRGVWTVGTAADGALTYNEWDWTQPCALLLGGEGEGLRRLVRERCDVLVRIPLRGQLSSLNVSVAAGVILYEAVRQRTARRAETYNAGVISDKN